MINKSTLFLAILLLVALPQLAVSSSVTVGDNNAWTAAGLTSTYSLSTLYVNETISIHLQYGTLNAEDGTGVNILLFTSANNLVQTLTCPTVGDCAVSFSKLVLQTSYYIQVLTQQIGSPSTISGYVVPIAYLNVYGDSSLRASNQLLTETIAMAYGRYHRIYVSSAATTNFTITLQNLVTAQAAYVGAYFVQLYS
jgi:hypothetical protein